MAKEEFILVYYSCRWEAPDSEGDMAASDLSGKLREYALYHRCQRVNWKGKPTTSQSMTQ